MQISSWRLIFLTFSSSSPALMASSVGTPSSSSSAVPSIDLFTCFIKALTDERQRKKVKRCTIESYLSLSLSHTHTHTTNTHTLPDGLCVDVYRSDSLQQELDHFQEGITGLLGASELFSDVSLKRWPIIYKSKFFQIMSLMHKNWQSLKM